MNKPTKDPIFCEIKAATRDLVRFVGGLKRAQEITGLATSTLSRWQRTDEPDLINLMATIALEKECGIPAVTEVMAGVHDRSLTDSGAGQGAAPVMDQYSDLSSGFADFTKDFTDSISDLNISLTEAELLDRNAGGIENILRDFRKTLAAICAGEDVPVVGGNVSKIGGSQ